jgi:FtsP/CotA-like multicopper oxidase with cupredoxin domain
MNRRDVLKISSGLVAFGSGIFSSTYSRLAVSAKKQYILDVQSIDGRPAYNGVSPGLTMRVSPGDVVDVEFVNSLPALHDDCTDNPNSGHGLNTTNLHTHGLHVSPTTDSSGEFDADNVFVSVVPLGQDIPCQYVCGSEVKTNFRTHKTQYRFELPDDHEPGTYWYHAHKHGATALQVGAGLSGPLIVADKSGVMPAYIENASEKIFMLMNKGVVLAEEQGGGQVNPTIALRPGEVQRWRFINALGNSAVFSYLRTSLPELEMYLIAYDGFTLEKRVPFDLENLDQPWLNPSTLAAGNRMDLIVRAPMNGDGLSSNKSLLTGLADLLKVNSVSEAFDVNIKISGDPIDAEWSDNDDLPGTAMEPFNDSPL